MSTENKHTNHDKIQLEWDTPEFISFPRGKVWYIVASTIVVALIGYAIFTRSITMAIAFILLTGLFIVTHKQEPKIVDIKITKLGVKYDKRFYAYNQINAFWVVYHPPYINCLYLRLGAKNYKYIKIELNHQDPVKLREILSKEIPEIMDMEERLSDTLMRLLRLQ